MYSKKGIIIEVIIISMVIFCGIMSHDVLAMYNDSVSVNSDSEVLLDQDEIQIDNAEETISEILETSEQELVYDVKSSVKLEGDFYYNKDGDLYEFNDEGEVISYTSNTIPEDDAVMISEDEIVDASERYLETLVSEPTYYRLTSVEFYEECNEFFVIYTHYIGEYRTGDIVFLEMDNKKNLIAFHIPAEGAFRELDHVEMKDTLDKEYAIVKVKQMYDGCLYEDDILISDVIISLDDDENICFLITVEFSYLDADNNIYWDAEVIYEPIYN